MKAADRKLFTPDEARDMTFIARHLAYLEVTKADLMRERKRSNDTPSAEVQRLNWSLTAMGQRLDKVLLGRDPGFRIRHDAGWMAREMIAARSAGHTNWDEVGAESYIAEKIALLDLS